LRLSDTGAVGMFDASTRHKRSQDLAPAYYDAGPSSWGKARPWLGHHDSFGPDTRALLVLAPKDGAVLAVPETGGLGGTAVFPLDERPQLEGLAFNGAGDMFLTSEGVDGPAQLRMFRYSP